MAKDPLKQFSTYAALGREVAALVKESGVLRRPPGRRKARRTRKAKDEKRTRKPRPSERRARERKLGERLGSLTDED